MTSCTVLRWESDALSGAPTACCAAAAARTVSVNSESIDVAQVKCGRGGSFYAVDRAY